MLVNQADAAVALDASGIGVDAAEGDLRERRLPRAVLTDERVNLAGAQIEVDAVNRDDARIRLSNSPQG